MCTWSGKIFVPCGRLIHSGQDDEDCVGGGDKLKKSKRLKIIKIPREKNGPNDRFWINMKKEGWRFHFKYDFIRVNSFISKCSCSQEKIKILMSKKPKSVLPVKIGILKLSYKSYEFIENPSDLTLAFGSPLELYCEYNRQSNGQNDRNYSWYKLSNEGTDVLIGTGRKFSLPQSKLRRASKLILARWHYQPIRKRLSDRRLIRGRLWNPFQVMLGYIDVFFMTKILVYYQNHQKLLF